MEDPIDVFYYLGRDESESYGILDVPLGNGQVVSIDLINELPDDPNELVSFLETEKCAQKYWISIAAAYCEANKLEDSLAVLNAALRVSQGEDDFACRSFLCWLYLKFVSLGIDRNENLDKAESEVNRLSQSEKHKGELSVILAQAVVLYHRDEIERTLEIYDKVSKNDSSNCFALLGKAQAILNKTKNYGSALKTFQQVLILNPTMKPDPRVGIGICCWYLNDHEMAVSAWKRALEMDPNNYKADVLLTLAGFDSTCNNSLSDLEFQEKYKEYIENMLNFHKSHPNDLIVLINLASFFYSKQEYDILEKICNKTIKLASTFSSASTKSSRLSKYQSIILSQAALWLGRVVFAREDYPSAQKYFHEAVKFNENNLMAKLGLGQSQSCRGLIEEAIITYEALMKTHPKCLEVNYSLGLLYTKLKSRRKHEQAIALLERYLRLAKNRGLSAKTQSDEDNLIVLNQEPTALNAFLVLSQLYESRDINQSLNYLNRAVESRSEMDQEVPLEVHNNIGVINFFKNHFDVAADNFQLCIDRLSGTNSFVGQDGDVLIDLPDDLRVTLSFNLGRAKERFSQDDSKKIYESVLRECPHYFSAKLRLLFLECLSVRESNKEEIKNELENLLSVNAADLEVRSFYGWFLRAYGKRVGSKPDADTNHQRNTLVKFNSRDCYALLSLANIYCIMAREVKSAKEDEKKKKYYIRAIELFSKVLSVDSKNVYAAQGLAIVYIENKEQEKGLDILRKIRDSLNDISVYLNLGHVLLEVKQYAKAIENYEVALTRFAGNNDPKVLSYLGRAWYLRGLSEKSLSYMNTGLVYCTRALQYAKGNLPPLKFNVAYVQLHVAEFVSRLPIEQKSTETVDQAITNLQEAIQVLNSLASDDEKHPPYPKTELRSRANLASTTLLNRLSQAREEVVERASKAEMKIQEAIKLRDEEKIIQLREEEEKKQKQKQKEEELAKERTLLQEQAHQWAEEARAAEFINDDAEKDDIFNEEEPTDKKKKTKKSSSKEGKPSKRGRKKNVEINDEDDQKSDGREEINPRTSNEPTSVDDHNSVTPDNDDGEDRVSKKRKVNQLSKEVVTDSDEDLFDENGHE